MKHWAIILLVAACAVLAVLIVRYMRRWRLTLLQWFLLMLNRTLNLVLWRTRINRPLPVAAGQGAIIIANHRSSFDSMFIAVGTHRLIHWMVAREYCVDWRLGWFFRGLEAIPAGRAGIDSAAVKHAIRLAAEGQLVGMMPEGQVNESDQLLLPGRSGAALVALKARVPVIPCYIEGAPYGGYAAGPLFRSAHVRVTVGEPLDISEFYGREKEEGVLQELTKRFLAAIAHLAGRDDYIPEVAGKKQQPAIVPNVEQP